MEDRHGITIAEYAKSQGIKPQAVYQQIKRKKNKDFISQHIFTEDGVKYLDDEAVEYLEKSRAASQAVVVLDNQKDLSDKVQQLSDKLIDVQGKYAALLEEVNKRIEDTSKAEQQILALTAQAESKSKESEELKKLLDSSSKEVSELKLSLDEMTKERDSFKDQVDSYKSMPWWKRIFNV